MKVLTTNDLKSKLIKEMNYKINEQNLANKRTILIISQDGDQSSEQYKNVIKKRCEEFKIKVIDKVFKKSDTHDEIYSWMLQLNAEIKNFDDNKVGFIILQPLSPKVNLNCLRHHLQNLNFIDLDGFTYDSLGRVMCNDFTRIPQTAKSIIRILEDFNIRLANKDIIVANSNNVIGRPLAMYLNSKKATVTLFNSRTLNQPKKVKECDIFISAIGRPNYYSKEHFRDGQIIIDSGTTYQLGKMIGDVYYDALEDYDAMIMKCTRGVGQITTLSLLDTLLSC